MGTLFTALGAAAALSVTDIIPVHQGGARAVGLTGAQLLTLVGTTYVPLAGGTMTGALKIADGTKSAPSLSYNSEATVGLYYRTPGYLSFAVNNKAVAEVTESSLNISTIGFAAAESNDFSTAWISTYFGTEGAGFLRMRGVVGTNPQAFRIYGTYTDDSNYQRLALSANGTTGVTIAAETLGTGGDNLDIVLTPAGTGVTRTTSPLTISSGTLTASAPALSITQTWNANVAFTASKVNVTKTLSDGVGLLQDWQRNGTSMTRIREDGVILTEGLVCSYGGYFASVIIGDTFIERDTTNALAQRNGTTQQIFRVYNTYTDASNYERLTLTGVAGTSVNITAETLGTGGDNLDIVLTPAGTGNVKFGTHSAIAAETVTGYITIKDAGGTTRKLAVVS